MAARDVTTIQGALAGIASIRTRAEKSGEVEKVTTIVESGGLKRIEQFQHYSREEVYQKAVRIFEIIYPEDFQDEEVTTSPISADKFKGNENREHTGHGRTPGGKHSFMMIVCSHYCLMKISIMTFMCRWK